MIINVLFPARPLVYTIAVLLPVAYLIGLIFTLKTHKHIYDIHVSEGPGGQRGPGAQGQYPHGGEGPEVATCINADFITTSFGTKGKCVSVFLNEWKSFVCYRFDVCVCVFGWAGRRGPYS